MHFLTMNLTNGQLARVLLLLVISLSFTASKGPSREILDPPKEWRPSHYSFSLPSPTTPTDSYDKPTTVIKVPTSPYNHQNMLKTTTTPTSTSSLLTSSSTAPPTTVLPPSASSSTLNSKHLQSGAELSTTNDETNQSDDEIKPSYLKDWSSSFPKHETSTLSTTTATATATTTSIFSTSVAPNQETNTQTNITNYHSTIHPLLIYSIRYEIRSYDLYNISSQQRNLVASSVPSPFSSFGSQSSIGLTSLLDSFSPYSTTKQSRTLIAGLKNTIGLDFYYSDIESFLFWTDVIEERIYRGTIVNGSITNVETVVQTGLATAEGLAVDWIGLNIYWVESTLDHIEVANMNGSSRKTLIAGDMESPRAIAVDPRYGLLFWTDWDKRSPRIERATMSGENRKTLVHIKEVNGGWPNGLTLDYEFLKIYWIDANSDSIHVVDYEGRNHVPLLKGTKSLGHPFSITLFENNLYWTDWKTNSVSMASKHDGSDVRELQRLTNRLFDVKVFHPSRQPRIDNQLNPCFLNNGDCSHLCLLSVNYTRKCECPRLMKLSQDNRTCETNDRVLLIGRNNEIRAVDMKEPLHHIMAPISIPKVFTPRQFEYDAKTKSIFWVDSHTNEVKRAQLTGNSIETIIDVIIESPSGLALDWISNNIYVTSTVHQKLGKIFVSNLNGEYISILMDSTQGLVSPKSLAVHPLLGLLFCIDEGETSESIIFVASMDGKNKRTIASKLNDPKLENPTSLSIDYELNRVYWVNQASNLLENASIQYYDIAKDKIVTVLDENEIQLTEKIQPNVVCVDGDYLIVGGRTLSTVSETIIRMHKHNLTDKVFLKTQSIDQLSALKVYNVSVQLGTNACAVNNGGCSQLCLPSNSTHRVCKCTMGYTINLNNETECIGKDLFIIYSYNLGMRGISIEPNSSPDEYYLPPIHRAFRASSIDYIYRDNLIYWVDNEEASITRINRDTTNYKIIVQGLESEESIALDWVAGNIYWIDPFYDIIEVARLNGSHRYVIVSGDMDKANGIVVNPLKGYIVWSDIGAFPKIETAKLDGSNRRVIVGSNLTHIDDLAIDYTEDTIYWIDSSLAVVERIREDGSERTVVYSSASNSHIVSIALHKEYLYVAVSGHQGTIIRCEKNTLSHGVVVQQHLGEGIRDIAIFSEQPMPSYFENPCVRDNGGCHDLCLFTGVIGQRRCICSHGKLNKDGMSCRPHDTFVVYSKLSQIESLHISDVESINNSPYPPIVIGSRTNIISLAVDYKAQRIIYSEITRDQICSVFFNGTDRKVLAEKQSLVEGIAFANDQLYWTSMQDNSISRLNTSSSSVQNICDNSGCTTPVVEKLIKLSSEDKLRGIAVDRCTSYVYWTNWNINASIQRASPSNGFKIESIITTNIKQPNGIAIDQEGRKLYWCDARLDKIETCDMDGSNRITLISSSPQHPFALAIWDNYVFWTDWIARGVFRADKYTGQNSVQIKKVSQRPMGIAVAAPILLECPEDLCKVNNGGCPIGTVCKMQRASVACWDANYKPRAYAQPNIKPLCSKLSRNGTCEHPTYHDIIMNGLERYNLNDPMSLKTIIDLLGSPLSTVDLPFGVSSNSTSEPQSTSIIDTASVTDVNDLAPTTVSPVSSSIAPLEPKTTETPVNNSNKVAGFIKIPLGTTTTSSTLAPPVSNTVPPCQILSAALQTTTDATLPSECSHLEQFRCHLSDKLICILRERQCDGNYDCPHKEDENDCFSSNVSGYILSSETKWRRYLTVMLVIVAAIIAASFLVFGSRNRRRWFMSANAFSHRRLFEDNETNIEISNPVFDENDGSSINSVHCAFSIDLNERTTNFSNPLYERQVLIMNDKHVTTS